MYTRQMTMVRIDAKTHAALKELAATRGEPMGEVLEELVAEAGRQAFYEAADTAYRRLREDPAARAEEEVERTAWEATLGDGLGEP